MRRLFGWVMVAAGVLLFATGIVLTVKGDNRAAGVGSFGFAFALVVVGLKWGRGQRDPSLVPQEDIGKQAEVGDGGTGPEVSFFQADLSRMTAAGWLLLLLTFAVVIAYAAIVVSARLSDRLTALDERPRNAVITLGGLCAAVGFFQLGRYLLRKLGIAMFR
jgi:hypothetical protein